MIIEFNHTYSDIKPVEKIISQKICGKINSIKLTKESTAAIPDIETKRIEFVVDGEVYDLHKIQPCKIKYSRWDDEYKYKSKFTSEVSEDEIDGITFNIDEVFEKIIDWFKRED